LVVRVNHQSCFPKVPDYLKENVKQVIEGKAAPKALKTQSDAVATMGTKVKMASAGMAMYVPGIGNPRLSLRPDQ
jgi:hypothetical protein